jgi:hypothetical protein
MMSAPVVSGSDNFARERLLTKLGGDDDDLTGLDADAGADGKLGESMRRLADRASLTPVGAASSPRSLSTTEFASGVDWLLSNLTRCPSFREGQETDVRSPGTSSRAAGA